MLTAEMPQVTDRLSDDESYRHVRSHSSGGKKRHGDKVHHKRSKTSLAESPPLNPVRLGGVMNREVEELAQRKQEKLMKEKIREPESWKESIRNQIEEELEQRVRDALSTPPLERMRRNREKAKERYRNRLKQEHQQTPITLSLDQCKEYSERRPSRVRDLLRTRYRYSDDTPVSYRNTSDDDDKQRYHFKHNHTSYPLHGHKHMDSGNTGNGGFRITNDHLEGSFDRHRNRVNFDLNGKLDDSSSDDDDFADFDGHDRDHFDLTQRAIRRELFNRYTRMGFRDALKRGKTRDGTKLKKLKDGRYIDCNGIILTNDGPFWPSEHGPLFPKPVHVGCDPDSTTEPLSDDVSHHGQTIHNQKTKFSRRWDRVISVFDSERTTKGSVPHDVPEGCAPSLMFESRFESGNLRQARRIGQFEYELVLKTDLYTNRHTQWYYFRVQRATRGVTYKFNIVNLLKRDSLYNHGMRPLVYSEKGAVENGTGWIRTGHHISYSRNYNLTKNPLLHPEMVYYVLEWQMEFPHDNDTCYFAHCYPYTFTDLKEHIDSLMTDPDRKKYMKKEVLCETKAGNSCFLLTVSSPEDKNKHREKKGVVVSARVHPGETNSSWMMKGLLEFITSNAPEAKDLRKNFVFKIIPMLNPDGVIVGNYRCSLAARDLNRNYRHPRRETFPTIWHIKNMMEEFSKDYELVVYCDLHGHSRKHNVFIYGCNSQAKEGESRAALFLQERLFPWMMSVKAPDKFSFRGCKFQVKKCKESTGRVVMWRQMGIMNSFTMEATFCGSKNLLSTDPPRHFTTKDFEAMGRHFCEVVMEYSRAKENKSLYSELILELTRQLTHQILEKRGMLPPSLPDFTLRIGDSDSDNEKRDGSNNSKREEENSKFREPPKAVLPKNLLEGLNIDSKQSAIQIIDDMSVETIDGCIKILEDLDVTKAFAESDSSDSDSEIEPELPQDTDGDGEKKHKRKKKKKKRSKSVPDTRHPPEPTQSTTLPEVTGAEAERQKKKQACQTIALKKLVRVDKWPHVYLSDGRDADGHKTGQFGKCVNMLKKYPTFINRYQKRSNNGIPIFSQERIDERATKRMEEMKKLMQEKQDKEASGVRFSDEVQLQRLLALTKTLQQQEENARRFKLDETSTSHGSTMLSFKHGYTHAPSQNPQRGLPVHLEYTVVEETGSTDDEDRCKHGGSPLLPHQTQASIKSPYTLMSPYAGSPSDSSSSTQVRYRTGSKVKSPAKTDPPISTSKHNNVYLRTGGSHPSGHQYQMRKPVSADVFSSSGLQRSVRTTHSENEYVQANKKPHSSDSLLLNQHHRNPPVEDISTKPLAKRSDGSVAVPGSNTLTPAYTDVLLERLRMHNRAMAEMKQKGPEKKLGQSKYE
ncbi:uncharacterized protein LOC144444443 isoform X3 [Glandiceps talaboti]